MTREANRDFRIAEITRKSIKINGPLFPTENGVSSFYREAVELAYKYNEEAKTKDPNGKRVSAGKLNASAVLHMAYQMVLTYLLDDEGKSDFFTRRIGAIEDNKTLKDALSFFNDNFPSEILNSKRRNISPMKYTEENMRGFFIYQVMIQNPALLKATKPFIDPSGLNIPEAFRALSSILSSFEKDDLRDGQPDKEDIFTFLTYPSRIFPDSLTDQIQYIIREWAEMLSPDFIRMLEMSLDFIKEEEKDHGFGGGGEVEVIDFSEDLNEYEAFSLDSNWMPRVVMMAKSTLVWLNQLSKKYKREITRLDQIPDEELDILKDRGFTALWLIGLWERSDASAEIKHLCGNPDAVASAYSLKDYDIAWKIGGWEALNNLRERCSERGIRLASDMVPNHTGIDGNWVYEHPDYYISQDYPPFPNYSYNGPDLSRNPDWEVKIEDHYYDKTDAAVTFRLVNRHTGETRYVFHGNDGTTMPWNDTAQLDYLNPITREAVIQKILHVARNFPIIRFDAAMTLAKRHIERLWYPKPGTGGDIAGRAAHSMDTAEFNKRIPEEFWREVVDRIAKEVPDTLLLAEAFWMMEGYFVRTLGMHRVYNSAFMNMLKNQENQKYRQAIKNTLEFEPEILKRYVNFMNNPDEETAIAQFGDGDRYFAVMTLLATLPGLPMVGHGQIEGFHEKYGMEYQRAYFDEKPNQWLIDEHQRRIFPLFRKRYLFSEVEHFNLYDVKHYDNIEESVFAYVNGYGNERTLVLVNNRYERVEGSIHTSTPKLVKESEEKRTETITLADNLGLHFNAKNYVLLDSFSDGLTYILPSISIFESGFFLSLNGYEAKVYWNIREVEDSDGAYEKLWKEYGAKGIKNIHKAINRLRLSPVYKILSPLREKEVSDIFKAISLGECTKADERALLLKLAEVYSTLYESYPTLEETTKAILVGRPKDVDPKPIINLVNRLSEVFKRGNKGALISWSEIDSSLYLIILGAFVLYPFASNGKIRDEIELSDRISLSYFLDPLYTEEGIPEEEKRALSHFSGLLLGVLNYTKELSKKNETTIDFFKGIMNDSSIMNLAKCNEYQGEVYFNKERMQEAIMVTTLGYALSKSLLDSDEIDKFARYLLDREIKSDYKLNEFFKEEAKKKPKERAKTTTPKRNKGNAKK